VTPLRIVLLEDSAIDAELIEHALSRAGMKVILTRVDTRDAYVAALRTAEPDVVISDHGLAQFTSLAALKALQSIRPASPFIVVSGAMGDQSAVACLRAGAEDFILKSNLDRLPQSIETAMSVRRRLRTLTPRQLQVLKLVADGYTTREIAQRLRLSIKTVETHRGQVMKRLSIHDVVGIIRFAMRVGLLSGGP
jgi:DNA-binding NarL/FixJ family response regulator